MKRKRLRIVALVLLVGLVAAIPASTQDLVGEREAGQNGNLPFLILVNRMALTAEQMEEIHGLLSDLLEETEANTLRWQELEQDMITFNGSAEELDEILETYHAETAERGALARDHAAEAIDQIKGILTIKQGEILEEMLPGFLVDRETGHTVTLGREVLLEQRGEEGEEAIGSGLRGRFAGRMEQRLADRTEATEQFRRRLADNQEQRSMGLSRQENDLGKQRGLQRGAAMSRHLEIIERLVDVLGLKLEAIE